MMRLLKQRIKDWMHERRIAQLRKRLIEAREGERAAAWVALRMAIICRSPDQVSRLERDRGLV